jgi:hypothetical protein
MTQCVSTFYDCEFIGEDMMQCMTHLHPLLMMSTFHVIQEQFHALLSYICQSSYQERMYNSIIFVQR